jgi:TP901 family phage tail tape measure protein
MVESSGRVHVVATYDGKNLASGSKKSSQDLSRIGAGTAGAGAASTAGTTAAQNKYNAALNTGNKALKTNNEMSQRQIDTARRQAYALSVAGYQAQALGQQALAAVSGWIDAFAKIDYQARRAVAAFDMTTGSASKTAESVDMVIAASNELARSFGMFDATTVAEGLYFYASTTGTTVKNQEDLNTVMKQFTPIMKAAGITSTNLETAIKGVNGIVNEFGMQMSDIPDIMAKLYSVTQKSAAEMTNYFEAFKMVGPIAKQMGATFDDTLIILSQFSDEQIKGGQAGRALRQTLTKMVDPSDRARKALDGLFTSTMGVGHSFDSVMKQGGSFVSYRTYIDQLTQSLAKVTPARRAEILAIMSTQNEMAPLISTIEAGIDSYNRYGKSMFETSKYAAVLKNAQKDFQKDLDTIARSAEASRGRITASFEAIKISLGNAMAPALATSADAMEGFSKALEKVITSNKIVAGMVGGFTMLSGAILTAVGSLLVLSGTFALLRVGYKEVRLMSSEMAASADWLAMKNSAGAYLKQLKEILVTNNKWLSARESFIDPIMSGFSKLKSAWTALTKFMKSTLAKAWDFSKPVRMPVRNAVIGSIRNATDTIGSGISRVKDATAPIRARIAQATALPSRAMDYLQRRVTAARRVQPSIIQRGIDFVEQRPKVQKFYGAISEQGTMTPSRAIPKAVMRNISRMYESAVVKFGDIMIKSLDGLFNNVNRIVTAVENNAAKIIPSISNGIVRMGKAYMSMGEKLAQILVDTVDRSVNAAAKGIVRMGKAYQSMGDRLAKVVIDTVEQTKSIANSLKISIKNVFVRAKKFFSKDISAAASRYREAFKAFIKDTPDMLRRSLERVKQFFSTDLGQFISKAKSSTVRFANSTSNALISSVNSLKGTILKNVVTPFTRFGESLRSLDISKNVGGFFSRMKTSLIEFGKMAMQRVKALNLSLAPITRGGGRAAAILETASSAASTPMGRNAAVAAVAALKPALSVALTTIKAWGPRVLGIFSRFGTKFLSIVKGIFSPFAFIVEAVIGFTTGLFKGFGTDVTKNLEDVGYYTKETTKQLDVLKIAVDAILLPFKAIIFVFDIFRSSMEFLGIMTARLIQGLMNFTQTIPVLKEIADAFGWVGDRIGDVGNFFSDFATYYQGLVDKFADGTWDMTVKMKDNEAEIARLTALRTGAHGDELASIDAAILALEEKNRILREQLDLQYQLDPKNYAGDLVDWLDANGKKIGQRRINIGENIFNEWKKKFEYWQSLTPNVEIPKEFQGSYSDYLAWSKSMSEAATTAADAATTALGTAVDVAQQGAALVKALKEIGNQNIDALVTKTMGKVAKAVAHATQIVADAAGGISQSDLDLAASFGGTANTILGAINSAVTAFNGLKNITIPSVGKIDNLVTKIQQIVSKFIAKLSGFDDTKLGNASVIAESISSIVNAVGSAISGFKDLQDIVTFNPSSYITKLIDNIKMVVQSFIAGTKNIGKASVLAASAKIAESADSIVSAIGSAASAFKDLSGEIAIPTSLIVGRIIDSMTSIVKQFIEGSKKFASLANTEAAAKFSDPITSILSAIGATAQAFKDMLSYTAPLESVVDEIISTMEMVLNKMVDLSNKMGISETKLAGITSFSNTIESIASAVTATYDAFFKDLTNLDEFRQVIDIDQVFGWMEDSLSRMFDLTKIYTGVNIEQIASAADAASKVAEAITSFFGIASQASEDPTRLSDAITYSIQAIIDGINEFNTGVQSTGANFVDQLILGMQSRESALQTQTNRLTAILSGVTNTSTTGQTQSLEITHVIKDPGGALQNASSAEVAAILSGEAFITNLRQSLKTQ